MRPYCSSARSSPARRCVSRERSLRTCSRFATTSLTEAISEAVAGTKDLTEAPTEDLSEEEPLVVASFEEIDALLEQTIAAAPAGGEDGKGLGEAG